MSRNKQIFCPCCRRHRPHGGHGYCTACAGRWRDLGRPDEGPPPPLAGEQLRAAWKANAAKARAVANPRLQARKRHRREETRRLLNAGIDLAEIAERIGVNIRTVRIYRNELVAEGAIMPRVRESDPNWMVGRMQAYSDRPASGRESLNDRLGAVYASDLTPDQWRHVAVVAGGILVGAGITGPGELRDMLEALGLLDYPAPVRRTNGHLKGESGHDRARKAAERLADVS